MWLKTIGHKKQKDQLKQAFQEERLAHAYLFCGIEGIGKRRIALGLAQAILCEKEKGRPCGECVICEKIVKGIFPDCSLIEPDGKTIKIDVLRQLKKKAYLHPLEGRAKVFIIDQIEKMTEAGANALLKILEEPPKQTYLLLVTSQPSRLLSTIRSRCHRIEFSPLTEKDIIQKMEQEGRSLEDAKKLAHLSQGSLKTAMEFDFDLFEATENEFNHILKHPKPSSILQLSEKWLEEDEQLPWILTHISFISHRELLQSQDQHQQARWIERWSAIQEARQSLERYPNKQLLVESLLFRVTRP